MKEDFLKSVQKAFELAALANNTSPVNVSRAQLRKVLPVGAATTYTLDKHGSFSGLKKTLFANVIHPLATSELTEMRPGHELSKKIADIIELCAAELNQHPHELTWEEFRKFINFRWGKNDFGIAKHNIHRAGGFYQIRNAYFLPKATPITVDRTRLKQQAAMNLRLGAQLSQEEFLLNRIEEFSERVFKGKLEIHSRVPAASQRTTRRVLNLVLSDLHIGSDVDKKETGHLSYGKIEESRRLASIARQVLDYKAAYRSEMELEILFLGDFINGSLHYAREGAAMAEQICRAIHSLSQLVGYLSGFFKVVRVRCATGNHDRLLDRHHGRAVKDKYDSYSTIIYSAVKSMCSRIGNVEFFIPLTPYVVYANLGHKIFATHGDSVIAPGYPSKAIQIERIEKQINILNAALPDKDEYEVFVCGHVHSGSVSWLANGAAMITNAALIPIDPFAVSIGRVESTCGQMLFETTEDKAVESLTLLQVGIDNDMDQSLDGIIQPWQEF